MAGHVEKLAGIAIASMLAMAVPTAAQWSAQDRYEARLRQFKGMTMAQFQQNTGYFPHDYYVDGARRVFVVNGPGYNVGVPLGMGMQTQVTGQCVLQLETIRISDQDAASSWQIVALTANGPCASI